MRIRNIFRGHKARVESVDFSPNGRLVLSGSWDGTVCIWNMRDGLQWMVSLYNNKLNGILADEMVCGIVQWHDNN
jgi:WD40 repeat protein